MKRILITGTNGFIAKSIIELLDKSKFEIIAKTHKELDVVNLDKVKDFFDENKNIDHVIHTATSGGRWNDPNTPRIFYENTKMFENLILFKDSYKSMVVFGSGAELIDPFPLSYYGLSKKYITEKITKQDLNVINLRLWGCFGKHETNDRFIKSNIQRYKDKNPMIIHQDKYMDYFYVNDIVPVLEDILSISNPKKEINLTYNTHYTLSYIATIINNLSNYKVDVKIENPKMADNYTNQNSEVIHNSYKGLLEGIKQMYNMP